MTLTRAFLALSATATMWLGIVAGSPIAAASPIAALTAAAPIASTAIAAPVQYRRGYGYYGRPSYAYRPYGYRPYYRPYAYGALPYVAGAVGTVIIAEAIRENRARPTDFERCAASFRSFDPRSGTYVTYGGETRICPYLE